MNLVLMRRVIMPAERTAVRANQERRAIMIIRIETLFAWAFAMKW
jgi:hypothetical protein